MDKLELAKYLLEEVGMPPKQQSTLCCLALLAMAKLTKDTPCRQASNDLTVSAKRYHYSA